MVNFLLGQQGGHTKYPCFLCYWDSRANEENWVRKEWPSRNTIKSGEKNIVNNPLVDRKNIILLPLHIKLGLMKSNLSKHLIVLETVLDTFAQPFLALAIRRKKQGYLMGLRSERCSGTSIL